MITIHITEDWVETNTNRARFEMSGGSFTNEDLTVVNRHTGNVAGFDGKDPKKLSLVYNAAKGSRPMVDAFDVLKQRYPKARFTTYGNWTKDRLGNDVDQIKYRR